MFGSSASAYFLGGCPAKPDHHATREKNHGGIAASGAGICGDVYRVSALPQHSHRRRPGGPALQLQRKTPGAPASPACALWQGFKARDGPSQNEPGNAGGDDWHNAFPSQLLYEPIKADGINTLQRTLARDSRITYIRSSALARQVCPELKNASQSCLGYRIL